MTATLAAPVRAPVARRVRPSRAWYWVFGVLAVLSLLAGAAIWLTGRLTVENEVEAFARFIAPNEAQLRFKRTGQYTVYYEYKSKVDDTEIDADSTPPAGIELDMRDSGGQSLELFPIADDLHYDAGGFKAVALGRVRIDQPGEYRLAVGPPSLPQFAVSVGRGEPPSTDTWMTIAVLVAAIGTGLSILGLVVIGLLRRRSRARAAREAQLAAPAAIAGASGAAEQAWARPSGDMSRGEPAMPLAPPAGLPPLPAGEPFAVAPSAIEPADVGPAGGGRPPLPSGGPAGTGPAGGGLPPLPSAEPADAGPAGAGPAGAGPALPPLPAEAGVVASAVLHPPSAPVGPSGAVMPPPVSGRETPAVSPAGEPAAMAAGSGPADLPPPPAGDAPGSAVEVPRAWAPPAADTATEPGASSPPPPPPTGA
jgi:hypothetical protein